MQGYAAGGPMSQNPRITPISVPPPFRYAFRIPLRVLAGIIVAAILSTLAACSGGATPTPALAPTAAPSIAPAPTQVPALAPTATPRTGLLLNEPESFEGYTLFSPARGEAYLIDQQGHLAHTWPSGVRLARLLDNGNVLLSRNKEIDPNGNVVWEYRFPQHHDLLKLPNGNVLILSTAFLSSEEAIDLGANPDSLACAPSFRVRGTRIVEARPTGHESAEVVWEWSVFDHLIQDFDPDKPNYGVVANHPERIDLNFALAEAECDGRHPSFVDWTHANALDYNPKLDQIMITVLHFSEIWIIDRSASREEAAGSAGGAAGKGGDLLYRWGNPRAHRAGTPADQRLFWPHAAHWIPDGAPGAGNALIFNNGNEYPGFERGYSSVDEIVLPYNGYNYRMDAGSDYGPNETAWTYAADPPESFNAPRYSNAQRLPNGNTLITDGPAARIFEVTLTGKTVWNFTFPSLSPGLYRAYRYPPDYPGLRGLDLTPQRTMQRDTVKGEPLARSVFDIHVSNESLWYMQEPCNGESLDNPFFLHILPESMVDLPTEQEQYGFESIDKPIGYELFFDLHSASSDGACAASVPLPDYAVAAIRTGQKAPDESALWTAQSWLNPEPYRTAYTEAVKGEPLARSTFDLYAADGALIYVKEQCDQSDITDRFLLHTVPERPDDLPEARLEVGFENLDFEFFFRGALFDGKCAARVPLPDYPVASIRTGQFGPGGELWSMEIAFPAARVGRGGSGRRAR